MSKKIGSVSTRSIAMREKYLQLTTITITTTTTPTTTLQQQQQQQPSQQL